MDRKPEALALARRLNSVREQRMRQVLLAEQLVNAAPAETVALLADLVQRAANHRSPELQTAIETLTQVLSEPDLVSYPVRRELYEAAISAEHSEIATMLFEGTATAPEEGADQERPLRPRGRPLTLGERKALARGHRRDVLEQLLRDPHPDVIEILLGNPHLTERDVLAIATHRSTPAAGLACVAASSRWLPRYAVKRALIFNPRTPAQLGVRLAVALELRDLRAVAADENLPEPLREQARTLLERATRPSQS